MNPVRKFAVADCRERATAGVLLVLFIMLATIVAALAQSNGDVRGHVHDASGNAVRGVSVFLETADGHGKRVTTTDGNGGFKFSGVGQGDFIVGLENDGKGGKLVKVDTNAAGKEADIDLTLGPTEKLNGGQMEFSDNPSFSVAAVTDWTAAGGHGSDVNLRASESLNRATVSLKPGGPELTDETGQAEREDEQRLRSEVARSPQDEKKHKALGEFLVRHKKYGEAIGSLTEAYRIDPSDAENEFVLATALEESGENGKARLHVESLEKKNDRADVHRLAGEIDEKVGDPLSAVHEFERATQEDPSEQNYFEWGSELLLHRAVLQARDVFAAGFKAHPHSARMLTALGAALFANARYDEAAERLCEASDLTPADETPYLFMGKIELAAPAPLPCIEKKLERFVALKPQDPMANYYRAMAIWKERGPEADVRTLAEVQAGLTRATELDPKCSDAYLQLGNLRFGQKDFTAAINYYLKAINANGESSEPHYRLGIAYDRAGEKEKAKSEFELHDQIKRQQAEKVERERREVKQFLIVDGTKQNPVSN